MEKVDVKHALADVKALFNQSKIPPVDNAKKKNS